MSNLISTHAALDSIHAPTAIDSDEPTAAVPSSQGATLHSAPARRRVGYWEERRATLFASRVHFGFEER
jgi:hypothetical protein